MGHGVAGERTHFDDLAPHDGRDTRLSAMMAQESILVLPCGAVELDLGAFNELVRDLFGAHEKQAWRAEVVRRDKELVEFSRRISRRALFIRSLSFSSRVATRNDIPLAEIVDDLASDQSPWRDPERRPLADRTLTAEPTSDKNRRTKPLPPGTACVSCLRTSCIPA